MRSFHDYPAPIPDMHVLTDDRAIRWFARRVVPIAVALALGWFAVGIGIETFKGDRTEYVRIAEAPHD